MSPFKKRKINSVLGHGRRRVGAKWQKKMQPHQGAELLSDENEKSKHSELMPCVVDNSILTFTMDNQPPSKEDPFYLEYQP